jgi:hypothetical protein
MLRKAGIRAWSREPLVHFLLLGAGLFLLWGAVGDKLATGPNRIVISPGQLERAVDLWTKTHLRPPTADEFNGLVEQEIEEEVYFREGMAMGLDRDDEIIRRRLKQKLGFLTQDVADQATPTDAELQLYLDQHRDEFGAEPRFAFSQIYFNPDKHGDKADADARRLLARLNAGDGRLDYAALGDTVPVPHDFESAEPREIAKIFGQAFAEKIPDLPTGRWVGPVPSGYGLHVLLVRGRTAGRPPQLAEVRGAVLREWQNARRVELNAAFYQKMRAKYVIRVDLPQGVGAGR